MSDGFGAAAGGEWSNAAVAARLRAAGCVFAEEEAALLLEAAGFGAEGGFDEASEHEAGGIIRTEPGTSAGHAGLRHVDAPDPVALERLIAQRVAGLPLEHILGWAEFAGLRIAVDPGVFVPRRRTEFLVQHAVAALAHGRDAHPAAEAASAAQRPEHRTSPSGAADREAGGAHPGDGASALEHPEHRRTQGGTADREAGDTHPAAGVVVLDLCCGSGAVGAAMAAAVAGADVYAADIDPAAVRSARRNIPRPERVFEGDLYDALPGTLRGRIDVIVVNAPYVPTAAIATMPPEARLHEARVALDGGADGLDVQRRVAADALGWLARGGTLLIETSEAQAPTTAAVFAEAGLHPRIERSDELDATVVIGTRA
ncbi:methyltransferase [Herbiconiux sp. 11R-BC]|uniref:methyltransferase n=1 Tax=Herbiconiux sp. 11R-BC TaxID=3111637 RepID=UPI003C090603